MQLPNFEEGVDLIVAQDPRYTRDAYFFLRDALEHTQHSVPRPVKDEEHHVTGQELLEGIRQYALKQFGPMATALFEEWGIQRCEDFGELVFGLVGNGLLRKTETDTREDFKGGYDFFDAFRRPFLPQSRSDAPIPPMPQAKTKVVLP